ncbi:MAG: hypothetical protein ABIN91_21360 [Mucilaginibacter sp.]
MASICVNFFPASPFTPEWNIRVPFLYLATWVIRSEQLTILQNALQTDIPEVFREISEQLLLPALFSLAEGDHELVFDVGQQQDIRLFRECNRKKKEIILKEFPIQETIRQYNCYLLPDEPLSLPVPLAFDTLKVKGQRKYIPGSEWLYLKIYVDISSPLNRYPFLIVYTLPSKLNNLAFFTFIIPTPKIAWDFCKEKILYWSFW